MTPEKPQFVERAKEFWGPDLPDWVLVLAQEAEKPGSSLSKVSRLIGVSASQASQIIKNSYPGNLGRAEEGVRAKFMNGTVECPVAGELPEARCFEFRKRANGDFSATSSLAARMRLACRSCSYNQKGLEDA